MRSMGNKEALLAAAKICLYEKGYARTTARDIATTAGVSLAGIGYHFRSTEALLNAALIEAIDAWGREIGQTLDVETKTDRPLDRFEAIWTRLIQSFAAHRPLLVASLEAYAQGEHVPEVRDQLAAGLQEGRLGLAQLFEGIDAETDPTRAHVVGSFYQALMSGLVLQWLFDPERAPSGQDLAEALRTIAAGVSPKVAPPTIGART
jgi:AcrR family transcriptional regulator